MSVGDGERGRLEEGEVCASSPQRSTVHRYKKLSSSAWFWFSNEFYTSRNWFTTFRNVSELFLSRLKAEG